MDAISILHFSIFFVIKYGYTPISGQWKVNKKRYMQILEVPFLLFSSFTLPYAQNRKD